AQRRQRALHRGPGRRHGPGRGDPARLADHRVRRRAPPASSRRDRGDRGGGMKEGPRDTELFEIIGREVERQNTTLQLIASENFASREVLEATGTVVTNKYSEGYPGKRYYGGNAVIDDVEELARTRCRDLFGAEHANVQPHSGSNANLAAYFALLEPGDQLL